jgi:acyl-CoA synthetase (AMP-forming)/AMP-acid ligase II/acyl carrier protein
VRQGLSIYELLATQAELAPEALAILAPGRAPLTYERLQGHLRNTVQTLNSMGVGRHDRVALVLPNGPELAVAFLAVAAGASAVPLNPAYRAEEFEFYLSEVRAKAVLIEAGVDSPVRVVAQARGLALIELSPVIEAEAGIFTLTGEEALSLAQTEFAQPEDVALVLHTSGTTSRPKVIPLTHTNICTGAQNRRMALELVESDRCLNVMPMFHLHCLSGVVLSSLGAGASVVCTPGFHVRDFFAWLAEFQPTWYTAVPTIHQAILAWAAAHREILTRCPLRLIRSAAAELPPQVRAELERVFDAPVIDGYGMTEAPSIACNPLPPRQRKVGSVGLPAGPEVAIMGEAGRLLPSGEVGEVVVRGASVMQGYENNPAANERAFINGWFRTGDQGYLDAEGYLFLTGRLKEIINRGGEKISPREVEEVLLDHPAVTQAVTFAIPHDTLGEEVAAAVVLREQAAVGVRDLQEFTATRLAEFKVPRRVIIVEELPTGSTGKVQRVGLAEKLGLTVAGAANGTAQYTAPRTPIERSLADIWGQVLSLEGVSIDDNFFDLGGHSVLAVEVVKRIEKKLGLQVNPKELARQTLGQLAATYTERRQRMPQAKPKSIPQRVWNAIKSAVFSRR